MRPRGGHRKQISMPASSKNRTRSLNKFSGKLLVLHLGLPYTPLNAMDVGGGPSNAGDTIKTIQPGDTVLLKIPSGDVRTLKLEKEG